MNGGSAPAAINCEMGLLWSSPGRNCGVALGTVLPNVPGLDTSRFVGNCVAVGAPEGGCAVCPFCGTKPTGCVTGCCVTGGWTGGLTVCRLSALVASI